MTRCSHREDDAFVAVSEKLSALAREDRRGGEQRNRSLEEESAGRVLGRGSGGRWHYSRCKGWQVSMIC